MIASIAYSTWKIRPSGLKQFTPLSYSFLVINMAPSSLSLSLSSLSLSLRIRFLLEAAPSSCCCAAAAGLSSLKGRARRLPGGRNWIQYGGLILILALVVFLAPFPFCLSKADQNKEVHHHPGCQQTDKRLLLHHGWLQGVVVKEGETSLIKKRFLSRTPVTSSVIAVCC